MKRILIGAALALALVMPASAAKLHEKIAPHFKHTPGIAIGKTALPSGSLGAVLNGISCSPNFVQGQVPSAAQWNAAFACGFPTVGGELGGPMGLPASTSATASLNIAPGTTPISPNNGDLWATPTGLFAQVAGSTIGPLGAGGGGGGSITSFLASGHYVNVPTVTTSASQFISAFVGPNAVLKNYGATQIAFHAATTSSTSVTIAIADGIIEPGGSWEIAIGTNASIAVASVVNGAISGTGAVQIIDGSGLWTGSGGGGGGSGGSVSISTALPAGSNTIGSVFVTPFQSNGNYLNVPSVSSTSANFALPAGGGANALLYNYGGYKIIYQLSTSGVSSVTAATADGVLQPGVTEIAVGPNTNIAVATTTSGLISSLQVVGGTGLWTGASNSNVFAGQTGITAPLFAAEIGGLDNSNLLQPFGSTAAGTPSTKNGLAVQGMGAGGAMTVICPGGGTACFGGTVGSNVNVVGVPPDASVSGSAALTAADAVSTSSTGAGGQTIWTLAPTAASVETFALATYQGALISARGTFSSTTTLYVEGTLDNAASQTAGTANWVSEPVVIPGQPAGLSSFNAPFEQAALTASGLQGVRCRIPSGQYTASDSITCTVRTTLTQPGNALNGISAANPLPVGGNVIQANNSFHQTVNAVATTSLISSSGSSSIYITALHAIVDGTATAPGNFQFEYGTGTSCTTPTLLTEVETYPVGQGTNQGTGIGPILVPIPSGKNVCVVTSIAQPIKILLSFIQR